MTESQIQNSARRVLLNEAAAVRAAADHLDAGFVGCARAILALGAAGRVVVTGVGKSAHIGTKLVATFNSTGQPALFMHAADAIHGDLGMIQPQDFVLCISKSGDTPEIKVLVPMLKRQGAALAALVGNPASYLAQQADFVLNASIEREACPHNLAPTTSSTVALALGDALAVALLEARQFSARDFAQLHPGGALGKRLYLRVGDLHGLNARPAVAPDAPIRDVILAISTGRLGAAAVLTTENELIGIITDGDLRRMLGLFDQLDGVSAQDIMTKQPLTVETDVFAVEALERMRAHNITQLVVTENGTFAGFLHLHDLLREGLV
ncbi:MAG: KpsF/GutQ family sugar-phosphate isomerase [Hymenobacteraceae bacterium]|nr:KpsF/GutQ family sugar-phosphate isomerase [Hymenobacteraceae bacterium]